MEFGTYVPYVMHKLLLEYFKGYRIVENDGTILTVDFRDDLEILFFGLADVAMTVNATRIEITDLIARV